MKLRLIKYFFCLIAVLIFQNSFEFINNEDSGKTANQELFSSSDVLAPGESNSHRNFRYASSLENEVDLNVEEEEESEQNNQFKKLIKNHKSELAFFDFKQLICLHDNEQAQVVKTAEFKKLFNRKYINYGSLII